VEMMGISNMMCGEQTTKEARGSECDLPSKWTNRTDLSMIVHLGQLVKT